MTDIMDKLIIIDSCMREASRTKMILDAAREVLSARYNIETIDVILLALSSLWGLGEVITLAAWNLDYMPSEKVDLKVREMAELARRIAGAF